MPDRISNRQTNIHTSIHTCNHIIFKLRKPKKKKILKEKTNFIYREKRVRITADLSSETIQSRREWNDILHVERKNRTELPS